MRIHLHILKQIEDHEQEIHTHPRPQFLMETGLGNNAGETEDCKTNGYPHVENRIRKKNRALHH
jgi:hypothetical protein